ncbi:16S rRNA (guanine(527)-N(7))-methyltransferase RsmG [Paraurantiacibacter namhicola]|uniref:Ribosomal RNA small subunit methyltransferase G n=1 Tax=Paraurantiacibacter namhicola TaxID=645517 RepID=A0A1C7D5L3_9SPHN|nr:16S rRNA (guanine(527)-N(7))-methyltransferase RsmG [Paraurantiacibacter namhicola]ANU06745.1 Ribosomal RNA small subunit methyltransferase G [Paraurantiacibacter namhicola]
MIAGESAARAYCAGLVDEEAMERLAAFAAIVAEENERQNLIAKATLEHMWQRHIADSLQLLEHVPRETSTLLDLGTGAGFPGMALAIARPDWTTHLVESRRKRFEWLADVAARLGLKSCAVHGSRLELVDSFPVDVICARAFAPLPKLLELSARFSTRSTAWLLPKGRSAAQEMEALPANRRAMFHVEQSLTDADAGILVGKGRPAGL